MSDEARKGVVSGRTLRGSARERTPPGQTLTKKWPVLHYGADGGSLFGGVEVKSFWGVGRAV